LYDRRAEIWAFDAASGARKLRTFHETSVPMSLNGGSSSSAQIERLVSVLFDLLLCGIVSKVRLIMVMPLKYRYVGNTVAILVRVFTTAISASFAV
jgi:hypothetical protein